MISQRIPLSSLSSTDGYLTVLINFDHGHKYCPPTDMRVVDGCLTTAEHRVLRLINQPAKLIALELNLSVNTIKKHISNMMKKTRCRSSKDLILWAERNKLLTNK